MTREQLQHGQDILKQISDLKLQLNNIDNYNLDYPVDYMAAPHIKKYMLGHMVDFKSQYKKVLENQIDILNVEFQNL